MPRYEVTAPDGSRYEVNAPEGATEEQAIDYIRSGNAPAASPAASPGSDSPSVMESLLTTLRGGASRLRDELLPPGDPTTLFGNHPEGPQQRRSDLAQYETDLASGKYGVTGAIADKVPEIALTAVPIARTGTMLARGAGFLGRAAPVIGDIAANAGYEGGKALYNGENAGLAGFAGGLGAAGGRLFGNVVGRAVGGITPEARTLLREGVTPTYGQAFGNDGIVAAAERALSHFPLAGGAVDSAKRRALRQYSEAEIDAALKGTGIPHQGSGFKAVREVNDVIHSGYEQIKPLTYLDPLDVKRAAGQAQQAIRDIPLLTQDQAAQVASYYGQKVAPLLQRAQAAGGVIDGVTAKKLDTELGELARSRINSASPADHPLGQAFFELQVAMRDALKSNDPRVLQQLQVLNTAYRRMLPVNIATERATGTRGVFTPDQFRSGMTRQKVPGYDPRLALNNAARETLNEPGTGLARSLSRNLGMPGAGALGAAGLHALGVPAEAIAAGSAAVAAGGTGVAHALYTEPGIRLMLTLMDMPASRMQWVMSLPPAKQQEYVLRVLQASPEPMRRIAAQVGSRLAAEQGAQ